ncbi:hypothetical protein CPC08DRAFT_823532 [Agrocybe pediades]|nr:hypothetical protein CPC08DRAFT_823532 [Agrocybe pediades]
MASNNVSALQDLRAEFESILQAQMAKMAETFQEREARALAEWQDRERVLQEEKRLLHSELSNLREAFEKVGMQGNSMPGVIIQEPEQCEEAIFEGVQTPPRRGAAKLATPVKGKAPRSPYVRPETPDSASRTPKRAPQTRKSTKPTQKAKQTASAVYEDPVKKAKQYQLLASEFTPSTAKLRDAMLTHIRAISGLTDASSFPPQPTVEVLERFNKEFKDDDTVEKRRLNGPNLITKSSVVFQPYSPVQTRQRTRARVGQIEQHILSYVDAMLCRFGLPVWGPNYQESPYSLFNSAVRIVALDTFKQALISHAYAFLGVSAKHADNMDLLLKVYDHVVHFYLYGHYLKEMRRPGSLEAEGKLNPTYQARKRLAEQRRNWLEDNGFGRYLDLIDAKATSDDERDPDEGKINGRDIFYIKRRPERSAAAELFIRRLAQAMEQSAALKTRRQTARIRIVPESGQKTSSFTVLPTGMPIDYFDPTYYNSLPPRIRTEAAIKSVTLLPDQSRALTRCADELMTKRDFNKKYQRRVLSRYEWINPDELNAGGQGASDDEADEEDIDLDDCLEEDEAMSVLDDEEEAEYISYRRSKISATLSAKMEF